MDPAAYCRDKATPEGSTLYYALLYLEPGTRDALTSLYALYNELCALAAHGGEPELSRAKLAWWHDELVRMSRGEAAHPITRTVQETIRREQLNPDRFFWILEGVAMDIERYRYRSFSELEQYCKRTGGELGRLAAQVTGATSEASVEFALRLGVGYQLTELLVHSREHLLRDHHYFPEADLQEHAVNEDQLRGLETTAPIRSLLETQQMRAARCLRGAREGLPEHEHYANQHALTLGVLSEAILGAVIRSRHAVLERPVGVTPVKKLWLAWSLARRVRRSKQET